MSIALAIGGSLAAALFVDGLGVRPDIAYALKLGASTPTWLPLSSCFFAALWASARLMRPDADQSKLLEALASPLLALALGIGWELFASSEDTWISRAIGSNSRICVTYIIAMSIAPLAALLVALTVARHTA